SEGANLYGACTTGATPRTKSIGNLTYRVGGNPGKSSEKPPENPVQLAHPQVASPLTYLWFPSSSLVPKI
ncbi:hypothetical protein Tco_1557415, partial [Tanacetum coccineum]